VLSNWTPVFLSDLAQQISLTCLPRRGIYLVADIYSFFYTKQWTKSHNLENLNLVCSGQNPLEMKLYVIVDDLFCVGMLIILSGSHGLSFAVRSDVL
jgi:hypothetical protein